MKIIYKKVKNAFMKIKIVGRTEMHLAPEGCKETVYDIYYGFTGLPTTWPFHTKWKIDKAGLSKKELLRWLELTVLGNTEVTIKL